MYVMYVHVYFKNLQSLTSFNYIIYIMNPYLNTYCKAQS